MNDTGINARVTHDRELADWRDQALALEAEVNRAVIGQQQAVRLLTIAVFARGHVLLEGDVGVGKTTLLRALAQVLGGAYERIEGTIDLMPSDLIYYTYINEDGRPAVAPGPLLRHGEELATFFFNEVNRARPQVHSLLLRVMAERSVTAFNREYCFPHLQVFADRNRVEKEETFEIPAAARDRFMLELEIGLPDDIELQRQLMFDSRFHDVDQLIDRLPAGLLRYDRLNVIAAIIQQTISTSAILERYAIDLCRATRTPAAFGVRIDEVDVDQLIQAGVSPRGMSLLLRAAKVAAWLAGRDYLVPEDLLSVFRETVSHRVFFNPVYELRRSRVADALMTQIVERVAAP